MNTYSIGASFTLFAATFFVATARSHGIEGEFVNREVTELNEKVAETQKDPEAKRMMLEMGKLMSERVEIQGAKLIWHHGPGVSAMTFVQEGRFLLATEINEDGKQKYYPIYIKDENTLYSNGVKYVRAQK